MIVSISDYYPFGSSMLGRTYSNQMYRYGFNGKEKDFETANDNYDFGARIYDGRLGRWLSLDRLSKKYPSYSSYNYCYNTPIYCIDNNGLEGVPNILSKAIDDAKEKEKEGYFVILEITSDGKIELTWYEYISVVTVTFDEQEGYSVKYILIPSIVPSGGQSYNESLWDKLVDKVRGVDNWVNKLKGNSEWKWGIRIVGLNGSNHNEDATKLSKDGTYISIGEEVLVAFGAMQRDIEKVHSPIGKLPTNAGEHREKLKEGIEQLESIKGQKEEVEEAYKESGDSEIAPGSKVKQNIIIGPDKKAYRIDSFDGTNGWKQHSKDVDTEAKERKN